MTRLDGRLTDAVRPTRLTPGVAVHAEGSVLIEMGLTKVLCTASVEDRVPMFLRGTGKGWITAEYGMLPRATSTRTTREASAGKVGGRTQEIQRLIGRSLRAVVDMAAMGEQMVRVDCDVLQADGSTRTASISGGWIALVLALCRMYEQGLLSVWPLTHQIVAVAVGLVGGDACADPDYGEDCGCDVDLNLVFTGDGNLIEVQGTAEGMAFTRAELDVLLMLAEGGLDTIADLQAELLATAPSPRPAR